MPPAEARPAATVVVLRDGPAGLELLMLQRSRRVGFFPDAWVFPGGRVDPEDARIPVRGAVRGLPEHDRAFAVAAIRECYEETGVWLGSGGPAAEDRLRLASRQLSLAQLDAPLADLGALHLWSWWITPESEPRRYDTRFFLSLLPPGLRPRAEPDGSETVASLWATAGQVLDRAARGELFLAPPTFRTLEELAPYAQRAELLDAAASRRIRPLQPILRRDLGDGQGWGVLLPGDPLHPDPDPVSGGTRIVLREGGWVSESP